MSLNPTESARACGILESAIEKLTFLGSLVPAVKLEGGAAAAAQLAGDEIRRTIEEQAVLEVQYNEALEARRAAKAEGNKVRVAALSGTVTQRALALREGMKSLENLLQDSPDLDASLQRIAAERGALVAVLEGTVAELRRDGSYTRLVAWAAGERDTFEAPARTEAREEAVAAEVERARVAVRAEAAAHEAAMGRCRSEQAALVDELARVRKGNAATLRYTRKEAAVRSEAMGGILALTESDLAKEIAEVKDAIEKEAQVFEIGKAVLGEEIARETEEMEAWKRMLAADPPALTEALVKATADREALLASLAAYQKRYEADLQNMANELVRCYQWIGLRAAATSCTHAPPPSLFFPHRRHRRPLRPTRAKSSRWSPQRRARQPPSPRSWALCG
jgi:hypothetical protein